MDKKHISVSATVRVVSTIKGKPLTETENFVCDVPLAAGVDYPADVLKAVVKEDVSYQFVTTFQQRLKNTPSLKNSIGGTKWSVEVSSTQY